MASYGRGFRTLDAEHADRELPVEGDVPGWLDGALVRNGPAKFEIDGERLDHWFDGLGMLHRYAFGDGVRYTNRFLRSEAYAAAARGERGHVEFASPAGLLERVRTLVGDPTDNANVHVARFGDEYVALTETPRRLAFDPESLETLGEVPHDDLPGQHVTAHCWPDPATGDTLGHATTFAPDPAYHVYRVPASGRRRERVASVPARSPAYLHSMAATPRYAVLTEPPFLVNRASFLRPGKRSFVDHFEWRPEHGTRFLVVDRETGSLACDPTAPASFVFHHANAFEHDDELVVDLVAYPDADIVTELSLSALAGGEQGVPDGELRRYRVPLDGRPVRSRTLYVGTELPRVSPAVRGRRYRYSYGQATRRDGMNGVVKVDVESGDAVEWFADGVYAEEPVFVPPPDADREDDGVVLATALDVDAERSLLVVLDARTFEERARARLPHAVPFGFHGRYFPEA
jgi:carotenoid cleavage dioxygenase-like enzyme